MKVQGKYITFPGLTDDEYEEIRRRAPRSLDSCPTCGGKRFDGQEAGVITTNDPDHFGIVNGQYRYNGEIHECDCEGQKALYRHYFAAGIGEQYMRLDWDEEYTSDLEAKKIIQTYIGKWTAARANGTGLTLWSEEVGTGKTFSAIHVAKAFLKNGINVFFINFQEIIDRIINDPTNAIAFQEKLRSIPLLIIDEIYWDDRWSDQKLMLWGEHLESVIRHRSNQNLPTVFTTNLSPERFKETYPRIYSLTAAKQIEIELQGLDYRKTQLVIEKIEKLDSEEVHPIS